MAILLFLKGLFLSPFNLGANFLALISVLPPPEVGMPDAVLLILLLLV